MPNKIEGMNKVKVIIVYFTANISQFIAVKMVSNCTNIIPDTHNPLFFNEKSSKKRFSSAS
jgi:hypothetical protein